MSSSAWGSQWVCALVLAGWRAWIPLLLLLLWVQVAFTEVLAGHDNPYPVFSLFSPCGYTTQTPCCHDCGGGCCHFLSLLCRLPFLSDPFHCLLKAMNGGMCVEESFGRTHCCHHTYLQDEGKGVGKPPLSGNTPI